MSRVGVHLAQVSNNNDPNRRGRIKVMCSTLFGEIESPNWIDLVSPFGYVSLPNMGDKVVIIAENNDARYCHYIGKSFANNTKDGTAESFDTPLDASLPGTQIAIVSEEGQYIFIDDNTNTITIKADNVIVEGDLKVTGSLQVEGDADIGGNVDIGGSCDVTLDATIGGISFLSHMHEYLLPLIPDGTSNTSAPV